MRSDLVKSREFFSKNHQILPNFLQGRTSPLREFYSLAKPGIIRGNLLTATAGFFLASQGSIDWWLYLAALGGLALVIASGCVFNNYIDRGIDAKMARTKARALVQGRISNQTALIYGSVLLVLGLGTLGLGTNGLTALIALSGWFFYVVVYSVWKRRSVYSTIVGSVAGAVPPVVGYTAVSGQLDSAAVTLFAILVLWQMPHFYAIGIRRRKEYAAAGIPILPVKQSMQSAKINILLYILGFTAAASLLTAYDYATNFYLAIALVLGLWWLSAGIKGFSTNDDVVWAKRMFRISLVVITGWSVAIVIDSFI